MSDVMQQTHHKPGCPWLVNPGLYRCTCFPTGAELAAQQKYTEMTSLREIKDKLDASLNAEMNIALGINKLGDKLDALAESQGKLLAVLNDLSEKLDGATDAKCDRITLEAAIKHHLNKADAFLKLMTIPAPPRKQKECPGRYCGYFCSLPFGHGGKHIATDGGSTVYASWPRKPRKKARSAVGKAR